MLGSILGAIAGPLVSSIFEEDSREDSQSNVREQQAANTATQKEFAQHGIRWRVEDAKAAGVHPLFALGASGASYAPNPVVIGDERPPAAVGDSWGRAASQIVAALFQANQAKDLALSQAVTSNAALASTVAESSTPFPTQYGHLGDEFDVTRWARVGAVPMNLQNAIDAQSYKPDERVSSRSDNPGISAATGRPESMEVTTPSGLKMLLPQAQTVSEAMEALSESPTMFLRYMQVNSDHYGPGWFRSFMKQYPGAKQLIEAGEYIGALRGDSLREDWLFRHGLPQDTKWTGKGLPPWKRGPTVSGRIRR